MRGATRDTESDEGGFMIVSRWGAVQHKLGCPCRPCKSRRKAEGDDAAGAGADALPGIPVDGGGFPGVALPRAKAEALLARPQAKAEACYEVAMPHAATTIIDYRQPTSYTLQPNLKFKDTLGVFFLHK